MTKIVKPDDAQCEISGSYFKIGRHNKVFIWLDNGWVRSTRPVFQIINAIKKEHETDAS